MINYFHQKSKKYLSELSLIVVTIIWGGTFVIIKSAIDDISSMLFVAIRFSIAAVILLPVLILKRDRFRKDAVKAGLFLGILLFSSFAFQTAGLKFTSATKSAFITVSGIVAIPFFQILVKKKFPTLGAIAGAVFVVVGVAFLSSSGNSFYDIFIELGNGFGIGEYLTLGCALTYALYVVYLDVHSNQYDFWTLLSLQIMIIAILGFLSAFFFAGINVEQIYINFSSDLLIAFLYTSLLATVLTIALQTKMQKGVTPTKAGIIYSFEPIFAALFAFFLINEKISNFGYIGSALIFSGLIVSELYDYWKRDNG
jgi:drug/metabolite transporter (DMT)-like permease